MIRYGTNLTARERENILVLRIREFSVADIAAITGRSRSSIKRVIKAAKEAEKSESIMKIELPKE